jgi:hypothetical protein
VGMEPSFSRINVAYPMYYSTSTISQSFEALAIVTFEMKK